MSTDTTTRWTVTVTKETDAALRAYLGAQGVRKGDISKFIEEAVRSRMFDQSVQQIKARNANRTAEDLQTLIDACHPRHQHPDQCPLHPEHIPGSSVPGLARRPVLTALL